MARTGDAKTRLREVMNKINKEQGGRVLCFANEAPNPFYLRRPTGLMSLDRHLGGGFPAGGVSYISGVENAGKTFLLFKTFAMNQRLYGADSCISYAPTEGPVDYTFMRKCGYKVAIPQENIEQLQQARKERGAAPLTKDEVKELSTGIGELVLNRAPTLEGMLETSLDLIRSNAFQIVAVDSISAAMPDAEADNEDFTKSTQQGVHAIGLKRFFQHLYPILAPVEGEINATSTIFTNQVVSNRKKTEAPSYLQQYIKEWAPAGSNAAKHGQLINLVLWSGAKEREKEGGKKVVVGKTVNWETYKGKAGTHDNIVGTYDYLYDESPLRTNSKDLVSVALELGVFVEKHGKFTLTRADGQQHVSLKDIPGWETLLTTLEDDFSLEMIVRREVLAAAGVECIFR